LLRKSFVIIILLTWTIIYSRHSLHFIEKDAFFALEDAATTSSSLQTIEYRPRSYVLIHSEQLTEF